MNASSINSRVKPVVLSSLAAAMFSLSTHAGLYPFNYSDSGAIPQGGSVFSAEETVSGIDSSITQVEIILTFNDSTSLTGNSSGIQGSLDLGTSSGSPYISFYPTATSSSGAERIYDATFTDLNGDEPNNTWALVLWDNTTPVTGIENGLVSWSLDISAVPEPITLALPLFGGLVLTAGLVRRFTRRRRTVI